MIKYVTCFSCMLLIVFAYGVFKENQNQQRKELDRILIDARNSLNAIENNEAYPLSKGLDKQFAPKKSEYKVYSTLQ